MICRLANHVIVGNEFLAEFASQYARAVTVIPTTIQRCTTCCRARRMNGWWSDGPEARPHSRIWLAWRQLCGACADGRTSS
jgi:hypothetical protein